MSPSVLFYPKRFAQILSVSLCASPLFAAGPVDSPPVTPPAAQTNPPQIAPPPTPPLPKPDPAGSPAPSSLTQPPAPPSQNVTINLINRLVERGILPKEDAVSLIKQAEADATLAREQAAATQAAVSEAQAIISQSLPSLAIPPQNPPTPDIPPYSGQSSVRVTYIPESVKAQMRDEIKNQVLAQARDERWADPRSVPEWTTRIRLFGDIRARYEGIFYADGNDNTGAFPSFNAINTSVIPFNVKGNNFAPQLNTDQNRTRIRLRVRIGTEAVLGEGWTAGLRIATGETNTPLSLNQTLGGVSQGGQGGQGGNFSKYAIWLDRGFLRYELAEEKTEEPATPPQKPSTGKEVSAPKTYSQPRDRRVIISLGRFDNPFYTPSDMVWSSNLAWDGIAAQGRYQIVRSFTPFISGGAFPFYNTDLNFSSNQPSKFASTDKWIYAGQLGFDWTPHKDFRVKAAGGYYHFEGAAGVLSDPYIQTDSQIAGNTDTTRPAFAQKGNTYRALRNIIPTPENLQGQIDQFQYFGLATPFKVVTLAGQIDYIHYEPFRITAFAEYAQNLAWDSGAIDVVAVNNRGFLLDGNPLGVYAGSNIAWMAGLRVGHPLLAKRGDWSVNFDYRSIGSDAVIDGFNGADFGGGGTNMKGFTFSGSLALSPRVNIGLRWMSANQIAGPPLATDILQFDLNGKF